MKITMGYSYEEERTWLFTDEGQRQFLRIRDRVQALLAEAGACSVGAAIRNETGSNWRHLACIDRLVELGEVINVSKDRGDYHRIIARPVGGR